MRAIVVGRLSKLTFPVSSSTERTLSNGMLITGVMKCTHRRIHRCTDCHCEYFFSSSLRLRSGPSAHMSILGTFFGFRSPYSYHPYNSLLIPPPAISSVHSFSTSCPRDRPVQGIIALINSRAIYSSPLERKYPRRRSKLSRTDPPFPVPPHRHHNRV